MLISCCPCPNPNLLRVEYPSLRRKHASASGRLLVPCCLHKPSCLANVSNPFGDAHAYMLTHLAVHSAGRAGVQHRHSSLDCIEGARTA